ncbi:3-keto-disaccharide hydrolase [Colwellia sp. MEBiC06753]
MLKKLKIAALALSLGVAATAHAADNQLTKQERKDGWSLLFNGKDMSQWRNFKSDSLNPQWKIEDNAMTLTGKGGGDILTKKIYTNFELVLDWKIALVGNSGIFILADELGGAIYSHAPEIQILDNERHSDNKIDSHLSGSIYDLIASSVKAHKPAGQWNNVRIRFNDGHLEVWQNGVSTASVVIGSTNWNTLVKNSKFATWQGFAESKSGHIGLQDHGDQVWFKNLKIKEL